MKTDSTAGEKFQKLVDLMARLRAPGGCPWDREQTFDTIKPYTLEETYEVLDAIDRRDWHDLAEELGDFMLQAVFFAQMAAEQDLFHIGDALDAINGNWSAAIRTCSARNRPKPRAMCKRIWGEVKAAEKKDKGKERRRACWRRVPRALPALVEAQQIASRAAGVGFDWENPDQVLDKLHEELAEFDEARRNASPSGTGRRTRRPAVRAGEPGALRQGGSRAGAAQDQRQVPRAVRLHRAQAGRARQESSNDSNIEEMEALWQEAKR